MKVSAAGTRLVLCMLLAAACISERTPAGPDPETVDCAVPLHAVRRGDLLVLIRGFTFTPETLRVSAGQTVTWVNCEGAQSEPHTTTARSETWRSPLLSRGAYFSHTFATAGTFPYACLPHPVMQGTIIVQ